MELDVAAVRHDVNALLLHTSELVRADVRHPKTDRRGADLTGADLRAADLTGADLTESIFLAQSQLDAATALTARSYRRRSLAPHIGLGLIASLVVSCRRR